MEKEKEKIKESKKPIVRKEKKTKAKKAGKKISELYSVSGDKLERKNKNCPKCGKGVFMAKHKDRLVCGKCYYVEFLKKE